ncbi:MAG: RNA methyltransferase [Calditrichia bacterium]
MEIVSKNVVFVLVEPETPGNVGSAARAIKTMGFNRMALVNPCDHLSRDARMLAHGSNDILEAAQVFSTLEEAVWDSNLVIATTNRKRDFQHPIFTPEQVAERAIIASNEHKVALVFGRESKGLTNEELTTCHLMSTIPAVLNHPSLNLAQSIMLYAYSLHRATVPDDRVYRWDLASYENVQGVYRHLQESLESVDFVPKDNWPSFIMRFKRVFARANPEERDVRLMHKILQSFDFYIEGLRKKNLMEGDKK